MRDENVDILMIGDICLKTMHRGELLAPEVRKLFGEHDMVTCDLGITLCNANAPEAMKIGPYEQPTTDSVQICRKIGIDMVRLAGNHIMDFGVEGMTHLQRKLKKEGITYIGVSEKEQDEAYKPYLYEKNDLKIACFSAGEISFGDLDEGNECGYAWVNSYKLEENIRKIRDMLLEDENIIVIISTTAYYWEIRDYLFSHLIKKKIY